MSNTVSPSQSLQVHLTSTNGPIDVFLCPDENAPDSPTADRGFDVNGNSSPFVKVLDGKRPDTSLAGKRLALLLANKQSLVNVEFGIATIKGFALRNLAELCLARPPHGSSCY